MKCISTIFTLVLIFAFTSSTIAQIDWTKHPGNPVFTDTTGGWASGFGFAPYVMIIDSTYHMWYCGMNDGFVRIGYATSSDGITWVPCVNNPVLDVGIAGSWEETRVSDPTVIYDGLTFHMWYTGMRAASPLWDESIGYATSPDGINWSKHTNNPVFEKGVQGSWDDAQIWHCSLFFDGSIYHMWYSGKSSNDDRKIGYATSPDGIAWTRYANNPVLSPGAGNWDYPEVRCPRVLVDGSKYHMFYSAGPWHEWSIGYATSSDGVNWTKYANSPVLDKGLPGSWDAYYLMNTSVLIDTTNSIFRMWYHGGAKRYDAHIGYATAPAIINVPDDFETIQAAIDAAQNGSVVLVDEGTYYENINFKGKAITVASHYYVDGDTSHISNTIINGSQHTNPDSGSVVYFISGEDTTSVLVGFTITGGSGTYVNKGFNGYSGGGIMMLKGGKVIYNKITGNNLVTQRGTYGAGITVFPYNRSANIVIEHNDIIYNSIVSPNLSGGGGLQLVFRWWTGGYCRLKNNVISHNSVTCTGTYKTIAGGIILSLPLPTLGTVIIGDNIVTHNELHCVASVGAGIYVVYFEPGGTVYDYNPCPLIYNNIVTNNYSQDKGGGLGVWTVEKNHQSNSIISPQPAFINNTIVNNKANDGAGIFNYDSYPLLLNNIFWNDLSESGSREIFNDDIDYPEYPDHKNNGIISMFYSDIQGGWEGEGNINLYPAFNDTSNNDFNLTENSLCVGNGTDSLFVENTWYRCPVSDYFSNQRPNPIDDYVDMGAIESAFPNDISDYFSDYPTTFNLYQNYPNPFNTITNIEYRIPNSEFVTLKIYNLLGQMVATLVSERQKAGHHQVEWDATGFASSVYYYKLVAGDYMEIKKMILLR